MKLEILASIKILEGLLNAMPSKDDQLRGLFAINKILECLTKIEEK